MNTKKLRQKILDLAIHGKLVAQNPNDEPASELLKRIRAEKEQLVKEGKTKKTKTTDSSHYENTPFEIPSSWEWCRLEEICLFLSRGKSPKYSESDKTYPVFAQKCNLKDGGISLEQARFLDPSTIYKWDEIYKLRTGDVLVNSTGTGTVGRTRLFHEDCLGKYPFVVPDSHVSVVRTWEYVISEFVFAYLSSHLVQQYLEDNLAGSTNQKELYIGVLGNILFPLPPLEEQKRIVEAIDKWFALIDSIENNKADLETTIKQTKSKILDLAIHGKLVAQNPNDEPASELLKRIRTEKEQLIKEGKIKKTKTTDNSHYENVPFEIPNSWEWTTLEEICFFDSGYAFSSDDYRTEGIPLIRISNIKENQISIENCVYIQGEYEEKFQINNGDLLIAMSGATTGKMGIYRSNKIAYLNQRVGNIKVIDPNVLCFEYRNLFLQSKTEELLKLAYGGAQPNISGTMILGLQAPLPPLEEQKRIVEAIDKAFKYLDAIVESL